MTHPSIDRHLAELARDRYSTSTLVNRRRILLALPDNPLTVNRETTQAWWETRQTTTTGEPRAASSLSGESAHVREFWRWAMRTGLIDRNPADWLPKVRQTHPAPTPVPEGDLYKITRDAPDGIRQAIALAALAGLRSAEVAAITWGDLDIGNGVLWVRGGKGGKDRSVPLSGPLLAMLGDPGDPASPIVGRHWTASAASKAIAKYMRSLGVDYTAHKLRARYATRFLAATGDLQAAATVLGHSDLSSISRYVIASSDTMRAGAEAAGRIG